MRCTGSVCFLASLQATLEDGGGAITTSWKAAKCDNPWEDVEQMAFDVEAPESVMTSFTQFNKEVCLQRSIVR